MNYSVYDEDGECIFEFSTAGVTLETVLEELDKVRSRLRASSPASSPLENKTSVFVTLH